MPLQIEVSPSAEKDLERQYGWYLKHAGLEVAERYRNAVVAGANSLAAFPGLGVATKLTAPRLRNARFYVVEAPFEVHLIFYRANDSTLVILRVMHGARDLPRRLR